MIRLANINDAHNVYTLIQDTILAIYCEFYSADEVKFFLDLHNEAAMEKDIKEEKVFVLTDGKERHFSYLYFRGQSYLEIVCRQSSFANGIRQRDSKLCREQGF